MELVGKLANNIYYKPICHAVERGSTPGNFKMQMRKMKHMAAQENTCRERLLVP